MPKTLTTTPRTMAPELATLAQRFETWRAGRQRGQRIPAELWQAATELARVHGLNPTAAALKLSYDNLQRRLVAGAAPRKGRRPPPAFVELPPVALTPVGSERGTVELVQTSGARLILRFPDAGPRDLLPLVQLFLRHRA
jgi:hypothetical protein